MIEVDEEILLRALEPTDGRAWTELRDDDGVQRHVQIPLLEKELALPPSQQLSAICDRRTGACVGVIGLKPPFRCDGPHLLCAVLKRRRGAVRAGGTSIAFSACKALLRAQSDREPVFAHVDIENDAGLRLVQALGGVEVVPTAPGSLAGVFKRDFRMPPYSPTG
jgi:RimJ/RimL family protein N-acetyltransferase